MVAARQSFWSQCAEDKKKYIVDNCIDKLNGPKLKLIINMQKVMIDIHYY